MRRVHAGITCQGRTWQHRAGRQGVVGARGVQVRGLDNVTPVIAGHGVQVSAGVGTRCHLGITGQDAQRDCRIGEAGCIELCKQRHADCQGVQLSRQTTCLC